MDCRKANGLQYRPGKSKAWLNKTHKNSLVNQISSKTVTEWSKIESESIQLSSCHMTAPSCDMSLAENPPWKPLEPGAVTLNVLPSAASVARTAVAASGAAQAGQTVASTASARKHGTCLPFVTGPPLRERGDQCKRIAWERPPGRDHRHLPGRTRRNRGGWRYTNAWFFLARHGVSSRTETHSRQVGISTLGG